MEITSTPLIREDEGKNPLEYLFKMCELKNNIMQSNSAEHEKQFKAFSFLSKQDTLCISIWPQTENMGMQMISIMSLTARCFPRIHTSVDRKAALLLHSSKAMQHLKCLYNQFKPAESVLWPSSSSFLGFFCKNYSK